LVRTRAGVERKRPRPWLAVVAVLVVDSVIESALMSPWNSYANWWREKAYGLTSQAYGGWFGEHLIGFAVGTIQALILFSLLYWLLRRAARAGGPWGGLAVVR